MFSRKIAFVIVICLFVALIAGHVFAQQNEKDVVVLLNDAKDLFTLYELGVNITSRTGLSVSVLADDLMIGRLRELGYYVETLRRSKEKAVPEEYYDYEEMVAQLNQWAQDYPDIVNISELTQTETGRKVMAIKVSDNAVTAEPEPAFLFDHAIHGDEKTGTEVAMCFLTELLENYAVDSDIRQFVDENEIFVVPIVNPDGHVEHRRYNNNNVDLNRNHAWWWNGSGPAVASEPEVRAMMQLAFDENFIFSISYHGGAELVNYPFDATSTRSPDDVLYQDISTVYGEASDYEIINGWDWYQVNGISEESYYGSNGTLAVIVEISSNKTPPASMIQHYCDKNVPAMKQWLALAKEGIHGQVTDGLTGSPVEARVYLVQGGWPVWTDPRHGDFHRFVRPGTYSLKVEANGYDPELVENVVVVDGQAAVVNVTLWRSDEQPVFCANKVLGVRTPRPFGNYQNQTLPIDALGEPDDQSASLGANGWIILDMGKHTTITNLDGPDFTVYEADGDGAEQYEVKVGEKWWGPWILVGTGEGTTSFDLPDEFDSARYLFIADISALDGGGSFAGADIDAVVYEVQCSAPIVDFSVDVTEGDAPLEVNFTPVVQADPECVGSYEWDFGDGENDDKINAIHEYSEPGVYTVSLTVSGAGGADTKIKQDYITVTGIPDDDDNDDLDDEDDSDDDENADSGCCG